MVTNGSLKSDSGSCSDSDLVSLFSEKYMDILESKMSKGPRTFGFEYEFIPSRPLCPDDLASVRSVLISQLGGIDDGVAVCFDGNIKVDFEPGGQIEYLSPPLLPDDTMKLMAVIGFIEKANDLIFRKTGIEYMGCGYIPGRAGAPLCLGTDRYIKLHKRLSESGGRGHEMMKATAAIHLHAALLGREDILPVFLTLCRLAREPEFSMSDIRRAIWEDTDPWRCGLPPCCDDKLDKPEILIRHLVAFAIDAVVLGESVAFKECSNRDFDSFLNHLTTIFTDVRFNLKGPTLELRTPDSRPTSAFFPLWKAFVGHFRENGFIHNPAGG